MSQGKGVGWRLQFGLASLLLCAGLSAQVKPAFVARYDGPAHAEDEARDIKLDAHGNIYVTGSSAGVGTGMDYLTIKYNRHGEQIWTQRYDGPASGEDRARAMALDAEGNVYVTGASLGLDTGVDFATIKYDRDGHQLWVARYDGPDHLSDYAVGIAVDGHGRVYVNGTSMNEEGYWDYATVAYDADGNQLWAQELDGPGYVYYLASALTLDSDGNVYVAVSSDGGETGMDYATVKYDAQGNQLWMQRYDGPESDDDVPFAVAVDAGGNVYVTGESTGPSHNYDLATVKYAPDGTEIWVQRFNDGGQRTEDNVGRAITIDGDGFVYVTGSSVAQGLSDYVTIKYDPDGSELWFQFYRGPGIGANIANAVAVDPTGNVYVTGQSVGDGTGPDYATLKYDASGNLQWAERYDGPGDREDVANALRLDDEGNVYVTGSSVGVGTGKDYTTIKYIEKENHHQQPSRER